MVVKEEINQEDQETLKTKEGKVMYRHKFEAGDVFIPQIPKVIEKEGGKNKDGVTITNYSIPVKIKGYNESLEDEAVFVTLTPSQAKTLQKKLSDGVDITQHVFNSYTYKDKDNIERVGVGFMPRKSVPVTFEDVLGDNFDKEVKQLEEDNLI